MGLHVLSAVGGRFEGFLAVRAHVGSKVAVCGHVASQTAVGGEGGVTQQALIRLQARVCTYVSLQHSRRRKTLAALHALIRALTCMRPDRTHIHAHANDHLHLCLLNIQTVKSHVRAH